MRTAFLFSLLLVGASLSAQTVEQWWLHETRAGIRYNKSSLYAVPGGMVCIAEGDSIVGREQTNIWRQLSFHFIDDAGGLQSVETRFIGPYHQDDLFGESGVFDHALARTGSGALLLASTSWAYTYSCLGGVFGQAGTLRLEYFLQGGFHTIRDFVPARKPVLISASNGEAWLAFEQVETIGQPPDTLDMRYRARIVVARISAENTLTATYELGEGYDPLLIERSDGTVCVLFRTSEHSASLEDIGLVLQPLDGGGQQVALASGLRRARYYDYSRTSMVAGPTTDLIVSVALNDSVVVFRIAPDLGTDIVGKSVASMTYMPRLLLDENGEPMVIWRRKYRVPLEWSPMEHGRMFGTIHSLPGTEHWGDDWSAFLGPYDRISLAVFEWSTTSFRFHPNITGDPYPARLLFVPPDSMRDTRAWSLENDGTLWVAFQSRDNSGSPQRMGVYRVRELSLSAPPPPSLSVSAVLLGNFPNPAASATRIRISLTHEQSISLVVTDVLGREVRRICDGQSYPAGQHAFPFDVSTLPPGVYFTRLRTADRLQIGRMVVTR